MNHQEALQEARQLVRPEHLVEPTDTIVIRHFFPIGADVPPDMYDGLPPEIANYLRQLARDDPEAATALRARAVRAGTPATVVAIYNQKDYIPDTYSSLQALVVTTNIDGEVAIQPMEFTDLACFTGPEWQEITHANYRSALQYLKSLMDAPRV